MVALANGNGLDIHQEVKNIASERTVEQTYDSLVPELSKTSLTSDVYTQADVDKHTPTNTSQNYEIYSGDRLNLAQATAPLPAAIAERSNLTQIRDEYISTQNEAAEVGALGLDTAANSLQETVETAVATELPQGPVQDGPYSALPLNPERIFKLMAQEASLN